MDSDKELFQQLVKILVPDVYLQNFDVFNIKELSEEWRIELKEEERKRYEKYLVNFIRDKDILNTARVEGKIEGKNEGKIEIAKKMKQKGKSIEEIIEYTGLSENQILGSL